MLRYLELPNFKLDGKNVIYVPSMKGKGREDAREGFPSEYHPKHLDGPAKGVRGNFLGQLGPW
jgi:hypothetical protein